MNSSVTVAVSVLGKVKTTLQMVAIAVLLALPPESTAAIVFIGYGLLYVAALMTLWSMSLYLQAAWPTLKQGLETAKGVRTSDEGG
jgi:CDP-diacylglycerol--glycerol-3-phosphate 3-phosphatidyltransferase